MKIPTLIRDYAKYADARLDLKAQTIKGALADNDYFPATPLMDQLSAAHTQFSLMLNLAATGDRVAIAKKNQARKELLDALRLLATDLESEAQGDKVKLLSTGFDLAADGDGASEIRTPDEFKLSEGNNPGEIKFSVKGVGSAVSYVHEYTVEPLTAESKWTSVISTSREHTFTGLPSGRRIYGRSTVIGRKSRQASTHTLSRIVQ